MDKIIFEMGTIALNKSEGLAVKICCEYWGKCLYCSGVNFPRKLGLV